jgi:hypothetical protein
VVYLVPEPPEPSWVAQVDGMWAALEAGKPTVNGYTSCFPTGWQARFQNPRPQGDDGLRRLEADLSRWLAEHGRPGLKVGVFFP